MDADKAEMSVIEKPWEFYLAESVHAGSILELDQQNIESYETSDWMN